MGGDQVFGYDMPAGCTQHHVDADADGLRTAEGPQCPDLGDREALLTEDEDCEPELDFNGDADYDNWVDEGWREPWVQ
jgi:hypothetical protein